VGKDEEAAWTGGLPKSDWSNLDATALNEPVTPNQYRSSSIATSQKGHNYRRTGLKDKFARSGDLVTFQHHVWSHLVDTGMDSIAYVPDPVDPNIMVNIVKDHGRFTLESVSRLIKPQLLKYDSYDKANDAEASEFLVDSLEADLAKELREIKEPDGPFPKVWIRFIRTIRSISIDRFEDLSRRRSRPVNHPSTRVKTFPRWPLTSAPMQKNSRWLGSTITISRFTCSTRFLMQEVKAMKIFASLFVPLRPT
jgi:hypothetical protein